jgi:hypothetical protein
MAKQKRTKSQIGKLEETVLHRLKRMKWFLDIYASDERQNVFGHDWKIHFKNGKSLTAEFLIAESRDFKREKGIRLDYISAFTFPPLLDEPWGQTDVNGKPKFFSLKPSALLDFINRIDLIQKGKLFSSDADIFVFYVTPPADLVRVYSTSKLKANVVQIEKKISLLLDKNTTEDWQSAYYLIPPNHPLLRKCEIKTSKELNQLSRVLEE